MALGEGRGGDPDDERERERDQAGGAMHEVELPFWVKAADGSTVKLSNLLPDDKLNLN
ncbi:hypothetical protein D3C86_1953080 [compost metagenome]